MNSQISVVIPTLGNNVNLERVLNSLARQELADGMKIEVIVAINGISVGNAYEGLIKRFGELAQFYFLAEKGVNIGRNHGLNQAQGAIILFLDDDCELQDKRFLFRHLRFHTANPDVFATGGGYVVAADSGIYDEIYNSLQMHWFNAGIIDSTAGPNTRFLLGGNFSIKAAMLRTLGFNFDEKITYGGSEFEFFKKALAKDLLMYVNDDDVIHHTHETLWTLTKKIYRQGRGKALIDKKYPVGESFKPWPEMNYARKLLRLYFNYVFWCGYYFYQKEYLRILIHMFKDGCSAINVLRYKFLEKISGQLRQKKDKGDRF